MTFLNTKIPHDVSTAVKKWLDEEVAEQDERYRKIVAEMEALDPTRDQWYEAFFDRLKAYGFNMDGDDRLKIPEEQLPKKPDRKHTVVY